MHNLKKLESNIKYLYSESNEYQSLFADIDFNKYKLDYYKYFSKLDDPKYNKYAIGSLLFFMAYITDYLDQSGWSILNLNNFDKYLNEISKLKYKNLSENSQKLINIVICQLHHLNEFDMPINKLNLPENLKFKNDLNRFLDDMQSIIKKEFSNYADYSTNQQIVYQEYIKPALPFFI